MVTTEHDFLMATETTGPSSNRDQVTASYYLDTVIIFIMI